MYCNIILLVDDESSLRETLPDLLSDMLSIPHKFITAGDGEAALKILESIRPNLVITDLRMPGLDGIQLTKKIKAQYPKLPVILGSGYTELSRQHQADAFLPKPYNLHELTKTIKHHLA